MIEVDKSAIETIEENDQEIFTTQYDVKKFLSKVDSRIKSDVGSDFVLAKLDIKDKEFVMEMVENAYGMKGLCDSICRKIGKKHKDYKEINVIGKRIFDKLMTKIYMIVILNRNVDKNYLMKMIGEAREDEENEETNKLSKMLDKIKNKDEEE